MEEFRERLSLSVDRSQLQRMDRRSNSILAAFGLSMFLTSVLALITGSNLLPEMWGELIVVAVIGLLYHSAIRKQSVDLRLGLVYTAVGILISLPILIVGTLLSLSMFVSLVPPEESILYLLSYAPLGLSVLATFKLAEPAGARSARNHWQSLRLEDAPGEVEDLDHRAMYLVQNKWTNSWFYLFLFVVVELLPVLLFAESSLRITVDVILVLGFFLAFLYRAYHILRREQKLLI